MSNESESQGNDEERHPIPSAWAIRAAAWVGRTIGRWQKRRATQRDEEFVRQWQRAWVKGRDSRWGGVSQDAVPYRRAVNRQAWLAGWLWANTQPDRRNALRPDRRAQPRGAAPRRVPLPARAHEDGRMISDRR